MSRYFYVFIALLGAAAAPAAPPVTALAYRGDGKRLVVGVGRHVVFVNPGTGAVEFTSPLLAGAITGLAICPTEFAATTAVGLPGKPGIIRWDTFRTAPPREWPAHADAVYGLAWSPDGKTLATAGYDRLIKLWNPANGQELKTLKDHSDSIYALAWQPGGKLLASAAADRTVKLWDSTTGQRLYSLTDATDWLYCVAFSPDGQRVAAGGVDKSIRVWELGATEGKLLNSFFAHNGAVLHLAFSPDGTSIYSLSEDRTVKVWDWAKGTELRTLAKLPGDALTMALRPDGKQIAIGHHDGHLTLHDTADGRIRATPLPEKPKIVALAPNFAQRGKTMQLVMTGTKLDDVTTVTSPTAGVSISIVGDRKPDRLMLQATLPATLPAGVITLTAKSVVGDANPVDLQVDLFPAREVDASGVTVTSVDTSLVGKLARPGDVHTLELNLHKGQEVGATTTLPTNSKLQPILHVTDPAGQVLVDGGGTIGFTAPASGAFRLALRDRDYRGGPDYAYRLHVGTVPVATGVFPLSVERGKSISATLYGVNLPTRSVMVAAAADAPLGSAVKIPLADVLNVPQLTVGEFVESNDAARPLPVPGVGNGRIVKPQQVAEWSFAADAGQSLVIEALARRYGSPLDPMIEVLDAAGQPIEQARLRCVAKTPVVLRDVPAEAHVIRMESWNEFASDDLVLLGQEVIKIRELPGHPDADCDFYSIDGKRQLFFGTTGGLHPLGANLYKVKVYPPKTDLAANGFPVLPLYYRNDDGGPGYGKDARVMFTAPAAGNYKVRLRDARGFGGDTYAYRLVVRPPQPDFLLRVGNVKPVVAPGQAIAISVSVDRRDGFSEPIHVALSDVPAGFSSSPTLIESGHTSATLILAADPTANNPPADAAMTVVGSANAIRHELKISRPKLGDAGDIVTHLEQTSVRMRAGQETTVRVRIERKNGFAGRIPVEVKGLPHGVRVLHIGLNGVLITEKESARTITLGAQAWVQPGDYPIAVVAKREGKNTEHAAPPVLLRIAK